MKCEQGQSYNICDAYTAHTDYIVHKRRPKLGGGQGSKIVQNCRRIVLKNCRHGGGGCQKSGKIADVVYGWSLI